MADLGIVSEEGRRKASVASFFRRAAVGVLLLAPMSLTVLWAIHLYRVDEMPLSGDEPHYLLIADSIYRDGDLNVRNNYEIDAERRVKERILRVSDWQQHKGQHLQERGDALYGKHEAGLGALIAIPFGVCGVPGAKFTMVFLIGLAPLLFFWVARRIVKNTLWALAIALSLSIGLPCSLASIHIYVDMLAGLLVLLVVECLYREWRASSSEHSIGRIGLMAVSISLLPWLKVAYILPAAICICGAVALQFRKGITREACKYAALSALPCLSLALFLLYLRILFGHFGHPNVAAARIDLAAVSYFLRLHVDVCHGILLQQPLLFLGVLGCAVLWRRDWIFLLFLFVLYGSLIGPNATIVKAWNGFCPMGRYTWSSYPLWIYPLCTFFTTLSARGRRVFGVLVAAASGPQVLRALAWVPQPMTTYHPMSLPSTFSRYTDYLPNFESQQANVTGLIAIYVGLVVLLLIGGFFWERPSRRVFCRVLAVYVLLGASWMYASAQPLHKEVWESEDWYMQDAYVSVGSCNVPDDAAGNGKARHCAPQDAQGRPFCLVFGPFSNLPAGNTYRVDYYMKIGKANPNEVVATLDATDGDAASEQSSRIVFARDFAQPLVYQAFSGTIAVSRPLSMVQYRVHWSGKVELWVDRIEVSVVPSE